MENIIFRVMVIIVLAGCCVESSYAGTNELMKLVQSKDFWSGYQWKSLEESALYRATKWTRTTADNSFRYYATDMKINDNYNRLILSVDAANRIDRFKVFTIYNTSSADIPVTSYEEILNWCLKKYGEPQVTYDGTSIINNDSTFVNKTSSWIFNDTIIELDVVYGSIPNGSLPVVINLSYGNKDSIKLKPQTANVHCRVIKFDDRIGNNISLDDMYFTIDTVKNEVRTIDNHVTNYLLKAADETFHLESTDAVRNLTLTLDINRLTGRLDGKSVSGPKADAVNITGVCDTYTPSRRKF